MINDIWALRTQPFSSDIVGKESFPTAGRDIVKHWRKLLANGYKNNQEQIAKIDRAVTEAISLLKHRNHLVHSFWPYGQNDPERLELHWIRPDLTERYGVKRGTYSMTIDELNEVNQRLAKLYTRVMTISFNSHRLYNQSN